MKTLYVAAMDRLYLACIWAAGVAIVCMSLIIPWGVFTRYVLGTGSQWPEPIAILLMMVFTFIGAAAAYRANAHIAVTMLTDVLPPPLRALSAWFVDGCMAAACAFVTWYGTRLSLGTMGQSISELPWLPVGVTYAALPLGSLFTLLFVIERRWIGPQDHRRLMRYEEPEKTDRGAALAHGESR
ncbi:TRAP transporter small permease [Hydrogenophaga sp.]|jgi:TRAP-type C4-dicarboxylate transport system permease small subunit|uniref:TRAP transporter small permease n=1 Tax=Hydrogenophaga sp. TaxID=1904254 RepID=UPI002735B1FF|nr:TRAP transporter small permease [Hydrogenophaga sp.]MDP3883493.1 TRAP transporter small permease [Hydrogenophaga sp.]